LTILEVLVSLAIFLMALAGIVRLVSLGNQHALAVEQQADALQRCQSKLAELATGATAFTSQPETPYEDESGWTWAMDCSPGDVPNLWNVQVRVRRPRADGSFAEVSLSQVILDPAVRGATSQDASSGDSSSSTPSSGTSGSTP
jgi:type II secretion system protein I